MNARDAPLTAPDLLLYCAQTSWPTLSRRSMAVVHSAGTLAATTQGDVEGEGGEVRAELGHETPHRDKVTLARTLGLRGWRAFRRAAPLGQPGGEARRRSLGRR